LRRFGPRAGQARCRILTGAARDVPEHAYVPGQTARHAEGRFAPICATAQLGMSPAQLTQSEAFRTGLVYLRRGYFWEAHELFEPVWMALQAGSDDRRLVQALIQLANAQLKLKMQRPKAAKRLCNMVRGLLATLTGTRVMGLELSQIRAQLEAVEGDVNDAL
jgi:hypothetical protein